MQISYIVSYPFPLKGKNKNSPLNSSSSFHGRFIAERPVAKHATSTPHQLLSHSRGASTLKNAFHCSPFDISRATRSIASDRKPLGPEIQFTAGESDEWRAKGNPSRGYISHGRAFPFYAARVKFSLARLLRTHSAFLHNANTRWLWLQRRGLEGKILQASNMLPPLWLLSWLL